MKPPAVPRSGWYGVAVAQAASASAVATGTRKSLQRRCGEGSTLITTTPDQTGSPSHPQRAQSLRCSRAGTPQELNLAAPSSAAPPHPVAILVAQHPVRIGAVRAVMPPVVEAVRFPGRVALIFAVIFIREEIVVLPM